MDGTCRTQDFKNWSEPKLSPNDAIAELNARFLESAIGFNFVSGLLVRKDAEFTHSEIILPALKLLSDPAFSGANEEYRQAHAHYRSGRQKECLNDCLKAFESTMKAICTSKGWEFSQKDTAKQLIDIVLKNELVPVFL